MTTPSHRLKLYRANKHLGEYRWLTGTLGERREYPVVETMKPEKQGPRWEYVLDLSSVQPPSELLPIVIGDYLFNVRSALDHLIVAIAPRKQRYKVSFPVFRRDPLARNKTTWLYSDADAARRWLALCACLPDDCIAPLEWVQPYHAAALYRQSADYHALSLLSSFQNADKHRDLVGAIVGLGKVEVEINGKIEHAVPTFKDGTVVVAAPDQMDVKVKGIATVAIQRGQEAWGFDMLVERLTNFLADVLLPLLEPFLD